jgi:hypothetical protein
MNPDLQETRVRERIEAYVQTGSLSPQPLPIHPDLAAHMSERGSAIIGVNMTEMPT